MKTIFFLGLSLLLTPAISLYATAGNCYSQKEQRSKPKVTIEKSAKCTNLKDTTLHTLRTVDLKNKCAEASDIGMEGAPVNQGSQSHYRLTNGIVRSSANSSVNAEDSRKGRDFFDFTADPRRLETIKTSISIRKILGEPNDLNEFIQGERTVYYGFARWE